jgi:ATP-dependent DNA helicase PIF1
MYSNDSIFLTWNAGTWKSTLINYFIQNTTKNVALLASTGVAAKNINWKTIFSYFWFAPNMTKEQIQEHYSKPFFGKKIVAIRKTDSFIIDEISMVRADLLDLLDAIMRHIIWSDLPFWWKQMIFVWDLLQLPPVTTEKDAKAFSGKNSSIYASAFSIHAKSWIELEPKTMKLKKIYRQSDWEFIDTLNAIRIWDIENVNIDLLNTRVDTSWTLSHIKPIYLSTTNAIADNVNYQETNKLDTEPHVSVAEIFGKFDEKSYPTDAELLMKVWMQVMFIKNDRAGRYANGTMWIISSISDWIIKIELEDWEQIQTGREKRTIYNSRYNSATRKMESNIVWSFTQFPIRVAYAISVHKSQWLTFEKAVIDLSWWVFAAWQLYVALSRVKSLPWLYLKIPIEKRHIRANPDIVLFDKSL